MPYIGEVLAVQKFIEDMTGHQIRKEVIEQALKRAEEYRERENHHRRMGRDI